MSAADHADLPVSRQGVAHRCAATMTGPGTRSRSAVVLVCLLAAVQVVDPLITNRALPHAVAELRMTGGQAVVAGQAAMSVMLAALFAAGLFADRWGRRRTVLAGAAGMVLGGVLSASAPDPSVYLAGRAATGLGMAGIVAGTLAFLPGLYPRRLLRVGFALLIGAQSAGWTVGLNIAGPLVDEWGWRAALLPAPVLALALVVPVLRGVPELRSASPRRFDGVGAALAGVGTLVGVNGLLLAGEHGWGPGVCAAVGAGAVLFALWAVWEWRSRRAGFPFREVVNRDFVMAMVIGLAVYLCAGVATYQLPKLVDELGLPVWTGALVLSAIALGVLVGALLGGRLRWGTTQMLVVGLGTGALGYGLWGFADGSTVSVTAVGVGASVLCGLGLVLVLIPQGARIVKSVRPEEAGSVGWLQPAVCYTGFALGLAVAPLISRAMGASGSVTSGGYGWLDGFQASMWVIAALLVLVGIALVPTVVAVTLLGSAVVQVVLAQNVGELSERHRLWAAAVTALAGAAGAVLSWRRVRARRDLDRARSVARTLGHAVLRPFPVTAGGLAAAGRYRPAEEDSEVGGDLYAVCETPFGTRIIVGDVRGKGLAAVRTVADVLGAFRIAAHETPDLVELAGQLDRQVQRGAEDGGDTELFVTALLLGLRPGSDEVEVMNRGHLEPVLVGPDGVEEVACPGRLPLGLGELAGRPGPCSSRLRLAAGHTLLLYTDGVSEARDADGAFYPLVERLRAGASAAAAAARAVGAREVVDFVTDDMRRLGCTTSDDLTLLALSG